MVGTIGPLVQGSLPRKCWRIQITAMFVTAFLVGAATIFFLFFVIGNSVHVQECPVSIRRSVAAVGLAVLAPLDLWGRRNGTYCLIGWTRQTPRTLWRRRSMLVAASIWGFDTGLAITTIRVTAATWGAVLLTVLGLSGWQTGMAYGFTFTIPITILMWTHRAGCNAKSQEPSDPGLADLLYKALVWQGNSAAVLIAGAVMLGGEVVFGAA